MFHQYTAEEKRLIKAHNQAVMKQTLASFAVLGAGT